MADHKRRFDTPFSAFATVLRDKKNRENLIAPSPPTDRLDGLTCLVTGANSGLGRAIAFNLARRGARLVLAIRNGDTKTETAIIKETDNKNVTTLPVDLSDLRSVDALIAAISQHAPNIDRLILNAGLMASTARKTPQGYEDMFAVHYLANYRLVTGLAEAGLLQKSASGSPPRIIGITSEAHRSAADIEMADLGEFKPHKFGTALKQYGHTKLAMMQMLTGLSQRYKDEKGAPTLSIFQSSPGPVNTRIARSAPRLIRPFAKLVLPLLFQSPEQASAPAVYLACSPDMDRKTGLYMHLMQFRAPSDRAMDQAHIDAVLTFAQKACNDHLA